MAIISRKYLAIILSVNIIILLSAQIVFAALDPAKGSVSDNLIGSTFKTLAKAFVAGADIEEIKEQNIFKLIKMNEDKFHRQYVKIYAVLKECPSLREAYGFSEFTTKDLVIENIRALDKKKINQIIDLVPNAVIAAQFKEYLKSLKEELQQNNLFVQINQSWNKIIGRAYTK